MFLKLLIDLLGSLHNLDQFFPLFLGESTHVLRIFLRDRTIALIPCFIPLTFFLSLALSNKLKNKSKSFACLSGHFRERKWDSNSTLIYLASHCLVRKQYKTLNALWFVWYHLFNIFEKTITDNAMEDNEGLNILEIILGFKWCLSLLNMISCQVFRNSLNQWDFRNNLTSQLQNVLK